MTPAEELRAAADVVVSVGFASPSTVQRRLRVGYARAAALLADLEVAGVVGPLPGGTVAREVVVSPDEWAAMRPTLGTAGPPPVSASQRPSEAPLSASEPSGVSQGQGARSVSGASSGGEAP